MSERIVFREENSHEDRAPSEQTIISYATPEAHWRVSEYGIAAVILGLLDIAWYLFLPVFDAEKHALVASIAWLLCVALTVAAYRQRSRRRTIAHYAAAVTFLLLAILVFIWVDY